MSLKDKKFADVYFCGDEDDGHAKKNKWFKTWRPSEYDAEDDDNDTPSIRTVRFTSRPSLTLLS